MRRRFIVADLILVALVAAAAVLLSSISSGSDDRKVPPGATKLAIGRTAYGRPIAPGFLGLSLEYSSIEPYAGDDPGALDPVFEQLIRNLNPGQAPILRIGGDTTDWTWWPVPGLTRPPGVHYTLTPHWLAVSRALADNLGARLILGINLEAGSTRLAATEARMLVNGLGRGSVQALEIGNEPAIYASFPWYRTAGGTKVPGRPRNYDVDDYMREFTEFAKALPALPLAGPSLGASKWMRNLAPFLAQQPRLAVVTLHRYPLQLCYTPPRSLMHPSLDHLMAGAATTGLADSFTRDVATAHAHRLPLRVDEINSVSCGADRAVSETFASSLWALDAMFELARVGVDGVNLHTFPGAGYELFKITRVGGRWRAAVAPEYYGLLLFARAAPPASRLLPITGGRIARFKTWATRARDGTLRVVLINKSSSPRTIALRLPGPAPTATVQRLSAPGPTAPGGVTLGGQGFGTQTATGVLAGKPQVQSLRPIDGRYVVAVPAASAAMLVAR